MLKYGDTKLAKEKFYVAKNLINTWDVNVENIVFSKLVETRTNSKYLIGYLGNVIKPLVLILPKISAYVKTLKVKDGDNDKNNKLMFFRVDAEKIIEKHKTIWIKIEDLKNIELNALPVYDDRYLKKKIRTYYDKIYTNFHNLNLPEDDIECESFTVISIESLLVYENKSDLDNCAYKTIDKRITDYLDKHFFGTDEE